MLSASGLVVAALAGTPPRARVVTARTQNTSMDRFTADSFVRRTKSPAPERPPQTAARATGLARLPRVVRICAALPLRPPSAHRGHPAGQDHGGPDAESPSGPSRHRATEHRADAGHRVRDAEAERSEPQVARHGLGRRFGGTQARRHQPENRYDAGLPTPPTARPRAWPVHRRAPAARASSPGCRTSTPLPPPRTARTRAAATGSCPELERLVDLLAIEEGSQQLRKPTRIEPLVAADHLGDRPPAKVEVVLLLVLEALRLIDCRARAGQSYQDDHFMLQVPLAAVPEARGPPPRRFPYLRGYDVDAGLLA